MSDPDNFLSRWSRRKLEPSTESGEPDAPVKPRPAAAQADACEPKVPVAAAPAQDQPEEPPFDPASLPSIESITGSTDIRDFLKPGVPLSLSRAALRRAWTSDPAIRDFIGIAENQWDFTNDSIPGFGPIDPADIPRLLAKVISSGKEQIDAVTALTEGQSEIPQPAAPETAVAKDETVATNETSDPALTRAEEQLASGHAGKRVASHPGEKNDAAHNNNTDEELSYAQVRHGHGSALPT